MKATEQQPVARFMSWRDLTITPAVSATILASAAAASMYVTRGLLGMDTDLFVSLLLFFFFQTAFTIFTIRVVLWMRFPREGVFSIDSHPIDCYLYNLIGFLCNTHLWFEFSAGLVPPLLRKPFYRLLGGRFGQGIISISGIVSEPWLVSIDEEAIVGMEALVLSHAILTRELMLGRVEIGKGAVVGAKTIVMPGVRIGEGAMVNAMSLIAPNTTIGAYEIWGGNPAKKLSGPPRPLGPRPEVANVDGSHVQHIRAKLVEFVVRHSVATPSDLGPDARLFSTGILGSMDLVQLTLFIEAELGVRLDDFMQVTSESIDRLDELVETIASKSSSLPRQPEEPLSSNS